MEFWRPQVAATKTLHVGQGLYSCRMQALLTMNCLRQLWAVGGYIHCQLSITNALSSDSAFASVAKDFFDTLKSDSFPFETSRLNFS